MTAKDFFNIVLKIFGLFFLREILNTVPQLTSALIMLFKPEDFIEGIFIFLGTVFILIFYIALTYQLIFKTSRIVEKLKLERDFNDKIFDFKIPRAEGLTISLIVIAGIILVNQIPLLIKELFEIIQERKLSFGNTKINYSYIIIAAVKIIIATLFIGERVRIVEFILSRQTKSYNAEIVENPDHIDKDV